MDEIADLNNRILQLNYSYERLKSDISERDNPRGRDSTGASEVSYLKQQL